MIIREKYARYGLADPITLNQQARKGVTPEIFFSFADLSRMNYTQLARLLDIHPRTIKTYKEDKKPLAPVVGEHLLKLIALFGKGEELFGSINEFNYWLEKPFWSSKEKPADLLVTPGGVDLVSDEMDRLIQSYVA
jgi:putative toxin-antitoxin system antitoxin component (TIGR02293 family)